MSHLLAKWNTRNSLIVILFLQFIAYIEISFDIPVARQVVGFIYLTFVPGFIIINLLKLDELDELETVLFSVGFSVAFLMIVGLSINEFGFLLGISQPLSLIPIILFLNSFVLVGTVLIYLRSEDVKFWDGKLRELSPFVLLLFCLPVLSVIGTIWVNTYENNVILLFLMIAISLLLVVTNISKKLISPRIYPFAVITIALAILYHSSLISNYIVSLGSDVPVEYFVFKTTLNDAYWDSTASHFWNLLYKRINAMLSVTVLPTIYSIFLNMDPTWVFKIVFPLIFSFIPLGLYQIWQRYIGKKYAFISAFLFMAESTFYTEMLGLNRQMIAEFFFISLLLVVLSKKMKPVNKVICFIFFSFALIISHYALAEIFLFFISFTFFSSLILKRPDRNITVSMIILFFVVMFTWYIYTSKSAVFNSFLEFGDYVTGQLSDFFDPASRGDTVLRGLGLEEAPSIWNTLSRMFAYITQAFIALGFIGLVTKRTKIHFEKSYFTLSSAAMGFLITLILVPGLANTLNMTRFYHILLFFLAPLSVVGAQVIIKLVFRREKELISFLLIIILVPYFLFQTGFVYEITGSDSWSITLSKHRMDALRLYGPLGYVDAYSVFGARWLSKSVDVNNVQVYADSPSQKYVLTIYGMMYVDQISGLFNTTTVAPNGVIYLCTLNVVYGKILYKGRVWNSSEFSFGFHNLSKVYTNGGCEVYKNIPNKIGTRFNSVS